LNMSGIISAEDIGRFEKNIGNEDSVIVAITDIQKNMDMYLKKNNKRKEMLVFFTSAWVEGMYIGVNMYDNKNEELSKRIVEQLYILEKLTKGLEKMQNSGEEIIYIKDKLLEIMKLYDNIACIKKAKEDEILFEEIKVSTEEIRPIGEKIKELRNYIINLK